MYQHQNFQSIGSLVEWMNNHNTMYEVLHIVPSSLGSRDAELKEHSNGQKLLETKQRYTAIYRNRAN